MTTDTLSPRLQKLAQDSIALLQQAVEKYSEQDGDIVYSNSVLEHVQPAALSGLFEESRRLIGSRGVSVHAVACNDHYAHFDPAISFVHYLQFSNAQWRMWNNSLNFQNRLRAPDFIDAAERAGLAMVHEERATRPGTREALAQLRVAPEFAGYSQTDLAATSVNFVARASAD